MNRKPMQQMIPMTKYVRYLIILNTIIWLLGNVIIEQYFLSEPKITLLFALTPFSVIRDYFLWQPFTYMFLHDLNPLHLVFNMLLLWWLGSELERMWGSRFYLVYYFVCGVGAALLYCFVALIYSIYTGKVDLLITPVVGASAAIFGMMIAYGIYFGERMMLFMFIFPMKAKHFVWILVGIEVVMMLNPGQGKVANLAHLGGIVTGYLFLKIWPRIKGGGSFIKKNRPKNLKLVVNNDFTKEDKPTWH